LLNLISKVNNIKKISKVKVALNYSINLTQIYKI
jgi:hypothetical protein